MTVVLSHLLYLILDRSCRVIKIVRRGGVAEIKAVFMC